MEETLKMKSLAKAVSVLECFSSEKPELGITEIAKTLDLQKSTVHNIVTTFEKLGYICKNCETGKYYLGVKFLQFSYIINNHMGFQKFFMPYMKQISEELNETVYLGIPHGQEVLYIAGISPSDTVPSRNILGEHAPMYCTGLGKAMLSCFTPDQTEKSLPEKLTAYTGNTIVCQEDLLKELEVTRLRGFSIDNMEHEYGVVCAAVPIFGINNQVIAAVSVSAPSLRLTPEIISASAHKMQDILKPAQFRL